MRRAAAVAVAALLATIAATAHAAERPLLLNPAIPPELQALEAKADALRITSERVSISTSVDLGHVSKSIRRLVSLFELKIDGVETTSPPAAALRATVLGAHVRLRYVEGHEYLFSWDLGRHDRGRPWIELGRGPAGQLFGSVGTKPTENGLSGASRYAKLFTLLNDGTEIHELAPTTLYGQPVTGFEAEVEHPTEATGSPGSVGAFDTARRPARTAKLKLSVYFAAGGAIVRAQVASGGAHGTTVTSDVPAIDFPYAIPPPPQSHVIAERQALKLFPSPHHRSAEHKSKQ